MVKSQFKKILNKLPSVLTQSLFYVVTEGFQSPQFSIANAKEKALLSDIWENGFTVIENYKAPEFCDTCIQDFEKGREKFPTFVQRKDDIRLYGLEHYSSAVRSFFDDPFIYNLAKLYTRKKIERVFSLVNKVEKVGEFGSGGGWHRDWFFHELKALLYLNDVDNSKGPFELLKGSHRLKWMMKDIQTGRLSFNQNRLDENINPILKKYPERHVSLTGKKGTLVIFDVTTIHRGAPLKGDCRYAITMQYSDKKISEKVDYYQYMAPVLTEKDVIL